jgi:hypothetical protein
MRSWESLRPGANRRRGFPGSHGPVERRLAIRSQPLVRQCLEVPFLAECRRDADIQPDQDEPDRTTAIGRRASRPCGKWGRLRFSRVGTRLDRADVGQERLGRGDPPSDVQAGRTVAGLQPGRGEARPDGGRARAPWPRRSHFGCPGRADGGGTSTGSGRGSTRRASGRRALAEANRIRMSRPSRKQRAGRRPGRCAPRRSRRRAPARVRSARTPRCGRRSVGTAPDARGCRAATGP